MTVENTIAKRWGYCSWRSSCELELSQQRLERSCLARRGLLSGRERDELRIVAQRGHVRIVPHPAEVQVASGNRLPQQLERGASRPRTTAVNRPREVRAPAARR